MFARLHHPCAWFLLLSALSGCNQIFFQEHYARIQRMATSPQHPLAGVWKGQWKDSTVPNPHTARAIIVSTGGVNYTLELELLGFQPRPELSLLEFDAYTLAMNCVVLPDSDNAVVRFDAVAPIVRVPRTSLVAEAFTVQCTCNPDAMHIIFTTHDALKVVDCGTIELTRDVKKKMKWFVPAGILDRSCEIAILSISSKDKASSVRS